MAQHDINIEAGIIPVLDQRGADALIRRIERLQKRITSGVSSKASEELAALTRDYTASAVAMGRAATTTSARIMLEKRAGVTNSFARAATRQGADMAKIALREGRVMPYASFSARQISGWKSDLAGVSSAYNDMLGKYSAFKGAPSEQTQDALLKAVLNVTSLLSNISQDRKKEVKTFGQIEKDTRAIHKEAKDFTKPTETANALGAAAAIKGSLKGIMKGALGMFGLSSVWNALKSFVNMGTQGIKEGYNDLVEQAVYGSNRNIAQTRALSKMYGMKEETLVGAERYAMDFRQRMMMGEVSAQEFVALQKLGSVGQMIASGAAGKNPTMFHKALQSYIRANRGNEAEMRWAFGKLGINPDIIAYGAIEHTAEREKMLQDTYEELVRQNKISALSTLIPSQILSTTQAQIKSASGRMLRTLFSGEESQHLLYRSMTRGAGFTAKEIESTYADLAKRNSDYYGGQYSYLTGFFGGGSPMGTAANLLYKASLDTQTSIAETYKAMPNVTREGTREGARAGIIEGLKEVLQTNGTTGNFDRTVMGLMNIFTNNKGAR